MPWYDRQDGIQECAVGHGASAQSYELKFMLATLPVIQSVEGLSIVCFLNDGMYLSFRREERKAQTLRRLQKALFSAAEEYDIPTFPEVEEIV
jgi:hypothetical protein